ncbi:hypothetical protein [Nocardia sp. NPDC051570]|uniref:hypothetical protein n=1 Tax=Nocardia sp. NPDC051570 TaxID=3364324 RepID=UPI00378CCAA0
METTLSSLVPLIAAAVGVPAAAVVAAYSGYVAEYRRRMRARFLPDARGGRIGTHAGDDEAGSPTVIGRKF